MQKLFQWFDNNILSVLTAFLLIFIPLYPKLPLFDALPGYIVRVRLEDFVVAFTITIYLIWLIRGKISLGNNPLFKPVAAYLTVGLLSIISAIFLIKTVPLSALHVDKTFLHYFRRIEYFSLFFIFYSTVKSLRQVKFYLGIMTITILMVVIYGFGQKYLYWPAFSTMNREFSKGWVLYLTEHARVLSTFGGHYDLAAFIMMALVILWSMFFAIRNIFLKAVIFLILAGAFWTLILTASRTSFIAYLMGITMMFFFWSFKKGLIWSISRWFIVVLMSLVIMLSFGDLSERFTKLLKIDERVAGIKSLLLSPIGTPPSDQAIFLENNPSSALARITSKSDQPPTPGRPSDVYQDIPLLVPVASGSATVAAIPRTYSKTAFMYDLSTAIRLDALWPMAINGFKKNPLLGSGYATLNKSQPTEFTEAESTDNDYLRSLGETGALGFLTFFGTILFLLVLIWRKLAVLNDILLFSAGAALAGLIVGLLTNAFYIDVFESSKVAFSFWAISGTILAGVNLSVKDKNKTIPYPSIPGLPDFIKNTKKKLVAFVKGDRFFLVLILVLAFTFRLYKINSPLADWHSWRQADTSAVTRNFVKHGVNLLYPTYDDRSNVASGLDNPKGFRFVEFPLYNLASVIIDRIFVGYNIEVSGRLTSILAALASIVFIYSLTRKYIGRCEASFAAIFYAILPYNIFFTRVILPEPFLVFSSLGMLYFFDKFISLSNQDIQNKYSVKTLLLVLGNLILALLFTSFSLLVKPFAIFLFIPMIYLWFKSFGIHIRVVVSILLFFALSSLPLILWRIWISNFPQGVPAYTWLFNGDNIRFKGAFFYWIFADRLVREILGYWGLPILLLGILNKTKKEGWFFYLWLFSILSYITVVATGNVRHDYYQTITIPIIVVFMAKGVKFLFELTRDKVSRIATSVVLVIMLIFMEMFGWYHIRDLYNINHPEIVEAGRALERKSSDKSLVIAPYNGDTAFLYQTNRAGWPIMENSIEEMIKKGADYYVSVNFDDLTKELIAQATDEDPLKRKYKLIEQTPTYVIIQLVPDKELPK